MLFREGARSEKMKDIKNDSGVPVEEIMQKIKDEAAKRKSIGTGGNKNTGNNINQGIFNPPPVNKIYFPEQRFELLINDVRFRSQIRTKIPNALNRFPVNKSKLLQKIILKFYELLFREQRAVNNGIADTLQELSSAQSKAAEEINSLQEALQAKFNELSGRVGELDGRIGEKTGALQTSQEALQAQINELYGNAEKTNGDIFRQIKDHKLNIVDMQRRLMLLLEEARKRLPEKFSVQQIENLLKEEDHIFDAMYATFEDKFRGTREDIKNRQKVYLPFVLEASGKTAAAPIIDIGCGRGEWLELLKENGFDAKGIDLNKVMIDTCSGLNLSVIQSDAIDYLRSLPANSLCAVTGFHIIEHLPFKTLIALFDESFRVLKPGGIAIFETPNPENLMVGACTFYTDPSHIKPLVPVTMQFIAEDRGFSDVAIKRLYKYSDYFSPAKESDFITANFYNEMDYSVIGYKK
ncbi:MAG: methyltransferase domain-containing protein [bacterium]